MSKRCPRVRYHSGDAYSAPIACWAQSDTPRVTGALGNDLMDPAELLMRAIATGSPGMADVNEPITGSIMSFCSTTPQLHFMLISAHLCWILA